MNKLIPFLFFWLSLNVGAEAKNDLSVFHRLLIYNANDELMVLKFKNTDLWVTPGYYQDDEGSIQKNLHRLAADYGLTISDPVLKGTFSLTSVEDDKTDVSIRNMYYCQHLSDTNNTMPDNIGAVEWLPIEQAIQRISFRHIELFVRQTYDYPDTIWSGSIVRKKKTKKWEVQTTVPFYSLGASPSSDLEAITNTLLDYIEGTANGQPERIARAFHPDLNLYTVAGDSLMVRNGQKYISYFQPGKKNNRIGRILSIDYVNDAAVAKVEIRMPHMKRVYIDYMMLLKYQGSWKIIHKSYTYEPYPE